jgi:mRNA-degrading endonuclease toxin of MazEF toxin-antitoxin module
VNFDPTIGAEIQKTRLALIVQNDIANRHSPITIVAAITSQFDEPLYPRKCSSSRLRAASPFLLSCSSTRSAPLIHDGLSAASGSLRRQQCNGWTGRC